VGEEISEAAKMSKRVAVTFQRAEQDLRTLEEIGDQIRSLEEDFRGVIKRVDFLEWRGIFRSIGIVTAGILMAILILFSTTTLSLWVVPVEWRTSSKELRKIQRQERVEKAIQGLSDEDAEKLVEKLENLLEQGEKQAQSRQEELSEELDPRGGEQTEGR
jgi:hypothetical protein